MELPFHLYSPTCIKEGFHIFLSSQKRKFMGFRQYTCSPISICDSIVHDCWNGVYFQTSPVQYRAFYSRDFGWCIESLIRLGHKAQVEKTLRWALASYKSHNSIKVAISKGGSPFNFPNVYSPDSVAYLFRSIRMLNNKRLIKEYKPFLQAKLKEFSLRVIDQNTGLVKRDTHFSSMKDYVIRDASCYDHTMAAMLSDEADFLGLENPLCSFSLADSLKQYYWNGSFFKDDLSGSSHFASDANLFPFLLDIFPEKTSNQMARKMLKVLQKDRLNKPFPLKYVSTPNATAKEIGISFLVPSWERSMVWGHLGMSYLKLLKKLNHPSLNQELVHYSNLIKKHKTFFEVYTSDGKPYSSAFYLAESGMIWAAVLQDLLLQR